MVPGQRPPAGAVDISPCGDPRGEHLRRLFRIQEFVEHAGDVVDGNLSGGGHAFGVRGGFAAEALAERADDGARAVRAVAVAVEIVTGGVVLDHLAAGRLDGLGGVPGHLPLFIIKIAAADADSRVAYLRHLSLAAYPGRVERMHVSVLAVLDGSLHDPAGVSVHRLDPRSVLHSAHEGVPGEGFQQRHDAAALQGCFVVSYGREEDPVRCRLDDITRGEGDFGGTFSLAVPRLRQFFDDNRRPSFDRGDVGMRRAEGGQVASLDRPQAAGDGVRRHLHPRGDGRHRHVRLLQAGFRDVESEGMDETRSRVAVVDDPAGSRQVADGGGTATAVFAAAGRMIAEDVGRVFVSLFIFGPLGGHGGVEVGGSDRRDDVEQNQLIDGFFVRRFGGEDVLHCREAQRARGVDARNP
mmetsp:Transcript_12130/g.26531  ORF Transcript_12130/g.26531 Transcript_12130/m.26531 type:complete len:411 (-) Transcript_12130:53-1285(-)